MVGGMHLFRRMGSGPKSLLKAIINRLTRPLAVRLAAVEGAVQSMSPEMHHIKASRLDQEALARRLSALEDAVARLLTQNGLCVPLHGLEAER